MVKPFLVPLPAHGPCFVDPVLNRIGNGCFNNASLVHSAIRSFLGWHVQTLDAAVSIALSPKGGGLVFVVRNATLPFPTVHEIPPSKRMRQWAVIKEGARLVIESLGGPWRLRLYRPAEDGNASAKLAFLSVAQSSHVVLRNLAVHAEGPALDSERAPQPHLVLLQRPSDDLHDLPAVDYTSNIALKGFDEAHVLTSNWWVGGSAAVQSGALVRSKFFARRRGGCLSTSVQICDEGDLGRVRGIFTNSHKHEILLIHWDRTGLGSVVSAPAWTASLSLVSNVPDVSVGGRVHAKGADSGKTCLIGKELACPCGHQLRDGGSDEFTRYCDGCFRECAPCERWCFCAICDWGLCIPCVNQVKSWSPREEASVGWVTSMDGNHICISWDTGPNTCMPLGVCRFFCVACEESSVVQVDPNLQPSLNCHVPECKGLKSVGAKSGSVPEADVVIQECTHIEPAAPCDDSDKEVYQEMWAQQIELLASANRLAHEGAGVASHEADLIVQEALFFLEFDRCPKELVTALAKGPQLKPCRDALAQDGHNFKLINENMVFVQPHQYRQAMKCKMPDTRKFSVIVSEGLEYLIEESILSAGGWKGGKWAKSRRALCSEHDVSEDATIATEESCISHNMEKYDIRGNGNWSLSINRTFLHYAPKHLDASAVTQSTTEVHQGGVNPRRAVAL